MSSWNDVISTYGGGELSYSFPESTIATLRLYTKLGDGDYTDSIILRVSDGSSHHLQLEGSSADTLKIVEYPGESIIVDVLRVRERTGRQGDGGMIKFIMRG